MATLVIHTQGTTIGARSRHLVLVSPGGKRMEQPLSAVDRLHVYGRSQVSAAALALLAERGATVAWFTRHGRLLARIAGNPVHGIAVRRAQYRLADADGLARELARRIITAKILNQRAVLLRAWRSRQATDQALLDHLTTAAERAAAAETDDQLRGYEGDAAARYLTAWASLMPMFVWNGRNRRPPRDPLNVLLSLGYTLLTSECQSQAEAAGLDPWLGVLHGVRPGRAALALDLVEAFRPVVVDRLILDLVGHGRIGPADFESEIPSDDDVDPESPTIPGIPLPRLTTAGFRCYLAGYERRMAHRGPDDDVTCSLRHLLEQDVTGLADALRDGDPTRWQPFRLRT